MYSIKINLCKHLWLRQSTLILLAKSVLSILWVCLQFCFTFIVNLCRQFLRFLKKGSRPKWTIYKHVLDNSKKCLSVVVVVVVVVVIVVVVGVLCSASTAYTGLCRGLKYLLKVRYIIPNHPNVVRFLISETLFLSRAKTLTYV